MPVESLPSVSVVNEITTGIPCFYAAKAAPILSSTYVIVLTVTKSAFVLAMIAICREWYSSASSTDIFFSTTYPSPLGPTTQEITASGLNSLLRLSKKSTPTLFCSSSSVRV